jgi:F420-dependent oxidoreductase-like protein
VPGDGLLARHRIQEHSQRTSVGGELSDLSSSVAPVLKLGLRLELYRSPKLQLDYDLVQRAEALGFHSVWTAEAYGADAMTPLAAIAARTDRIKLGTAVVQLAGRPPAMLGMQALTVDALGGGERMIIGLGLSGPQIVEGWYGQPWGKPNARLRDYVEILRAVLEREGPVSHDGPEISLPYTGPGALGQGKALKSILHAVSDVPIWLASVGPRNTELCAERCDGWLPMGLPPQGTDDPDVRAALDRGFAKRRDGRTRADFEIFNGLTVKITDDVKGWLDAIRPGRAIYVGGMGSSSHNYHVESMAKRGFADDAARIQELFLAGRREEAIAAMPDEALLQGTLVGTAKSIRQQWEAGGVVPPGVTGVIVGSDRPEELELIAELVGVEGRDA